MNILKRIGPQEWIYDELKLMTDTEFQFASEEPAVDTVEEICESMQFYPPQDILTGSDILYEYNEEVTVQMKRSINVAFFFPQIIRAVTEALQPNKMNIMVWTKKLPDHLKYNKKEQWFGTEYTDLG